MKNKTIKLLTPLLGVIFLFPKISGIRANANSLEQVKNAEFCVLSPQGEYKFYYPELNVLKSDKKEKYFLCQLDEQVEKIIADNTLSAVDATFSFDKNGFTYYPERTGIVCDKERLKKEIEESLSNPIFDGEKVRFSSVELKCENCPVKVSVSALKKRTAKLSTFTTYFSSSDKGRCQNISLAADKINGLTLRAGERFSFNKTVGERTEKNGFCQAKIIQSGEFVQGIGGGVCQVSTTLYNAALLSGMKITKFAPHSLAVSYVSPSRDAMVSSATDFCFENPFSFPVYLSAKTGDGFLTVSIYGKQSGREYKIVSKTLKKFSPLPPEERQGDEEKVLRYEKEGIESEAYLEEYLSGVLIARKRLRVDRYAPVRGIIVKKVAQATKKMR